MADVAELDILRSLKRRGVAVIAIFGVLVAIASGLFVRGIVLNGIAGITQSGLSGFIAQAYSRADVGSASPVAAVRLDLLLRPRIAQGSLSSVVLMRADGTVLYHSTNSAEKLPSARNIAGALAGKLSADVVVEGATQMLRVVGPAEVSGDTRVVWVAWRPYALVANSVRVAAGMVALIVALGASMALILLVIFVSQAERQVERQAAQERITQQRLSSVLADLESASLGTLVSLLMAVDARDRYTAMHSAHVADYAKAIAAEMGRDDLTKLLERAGLLHDLGKIGTPEYVLKKPGRLTPEEFAVIAEHPATGARIIESIPFLAEVVPAIRGHHERWDGSGYPDGLKGPETPFAARVLGVADAFDAMLTNRPYHAAMTEEEARQELIDGRGTQFDAEIVDAFLTGLRNERIVSLGSPAR